MYRIEDRAAKLEPQISQMRGALDAYLLVEFAAREQEALIVGDIVDKLTAYNFAHLCHLSSENHGIAGFIDEQTEETRNGVRWFFGLKKSPAQVISKYPELGEAASGIINHAVEGIWEKLENECGILVIRLEDVFVGHEDPLLDLEGADTFILAAIQRRIKRFQADEEGDVRQWTDKQKRIYSFLTDLSIKNKPAFGSINTAIVNALQQGKSGIVLNLNHPELNEAAEVISVVPEQA